MSDEEDVRDESWEAVNELPEHSKKIKTYGYKSQRINLMDNSNELIHKDAVAYKAPKEKVEVIYSKEEIETPTEEIETPTEEMQPPQIETLTQINTKALPLYAKTYQLEKFKKNAMIIFNHEDIEGYPKRKGTNEDVAALCSTFSKFGFEMEVHKDLTKANLFGELKKFSSRDFTEYGCVAMAILTHGTDNGLLLAKDMGHLYSEQDVISHFKAHSKPTLYTKPVVLIIQACRGKESTRGVAVLRHATVFKDHDEELQTYYLPVESDMLIFHSCFAGKPSYRPENGSWFIQTLCNQIKKLYRTHDLESIITEVKREVAAEKYYMERSSRSLELEVNKQMPVLTSTLIRKLYLRRAEHEEDQSIDSETSADGSVETNNFGGQIEECCCFLEHFDYMKKCLSYIVKNNPRDIVARGLLDVAEFESGVNDEKAKATLNAISKYLQQHYKKSEHHKFIHFYDKGLETDAIDFVTEEVQENETSLRRIVKTWGEWSQSYTVRCIGTCLGVYVTYNFVKNKVI